MVRLAMATALAVCVAVPALAQDHSAKARVAAGEVIFHYNCEACHAKDPAKNAFGPGLHGVIGRPAGSLPRFDYSDALKNSGIVWDEEHLRAWMSDNEALVPGTRMRHVAITDPAEQEFLLAYIESLTE